MRTAKFSQSVGSVFWCLFIGLLPVLPDMTGGPTVFRDVCIYRSRSSFDYN